MNTQTTTNQQVQAQSGHTGRILSAIVLFVSVILIIGFIAISQSGNGLVNAVFAVTPDSGRCGMSQREFSELPVRLQLELTETCNRPPDVLP